jgi:hypothetical protein
MLALSVAALALTSLAQAAGARGARLAGSYEVLGIGP